MDTNKRFHGILHSITTAATLGLLALGLVTAAPGAAQVPAPQPSAQDVGIDQRLDEQIPLDLTFRDEQGETVALREFFGDKPLVLSLVYFDCPAQCNIILEGMVKAFSNIDFDLGGEYNALTVSFDPSDTAEVANARRVMYTEMYGRDGARDSWRFLTGDQESIDALADAVGFRYVYDENIDEFAHSSGIMVVTPDGRLSRYFYGLEYSPRDLRFALMEASAGRIGSIVDELLLLCYTYDPTTGQYGMVIMNLVRFGALATVLVVGGFVGLMLLRERRAPRSASPAAETHS